MVLNKLECFNSFTTKLEIEKKNLICTCFLSLDEDKEKRMQREKMFLIFKWYFGKPSISFFLFLLALTWPWIYLTPTFNFHLKLSSSFNLVYIVKGNNSQWYIFTNFETQSSSLWTKLHFFLCLQKWFLPLRQNWKLQKYQFENIFFDRR